VVLKESWGKTKLETSVSKLGLRSVHVDFGLMLFNAWLAIPKRVIDTRADHSVKNVNTRY